jgi:hypothetical protein
MCVCVYQVPLCMCLSYVMIGYYPLPPPSQALKTLQGKLDEECEIFDKEVDERNREIKDKTEELKHLKKVTALRMEYEQVCVCVHLHARIHMYM